MTSSRIKTLDGIISSWPEVKRRQTKTMIVFSIADVNFCWLSPASGMVQVCPSLGSKMKPTRHLEYKNGKVSVIYKSGRVDAVYDDPSYNLIARLGYPSFMCSKISKDDALNLIQQSYNEAKREAERRINWNP